MYTLVLEDENGNILNSIQYIKEEFYNSSEIRDTSSKVTYSGLLNLLNELGSNVDVLIPFNNGENFIINYLSKFHSNFLNDMNLNESDLINHYFFEVFPIFDKLGLSGIFREVFFSNHSYNFKILFYEDNNLYSSIKLSLVNYEGVLLLLNKDITSLDLAIKREEDLFNNSIHPLVVIQDYVVVRVNDAYADMVGVNKEDLIGRHYNIDSIEIDGSTNTKWKENFQKILNKELLFYIDERSYTTLKGKKLFIKIQASPVDFNGKPAIQFFTIDISKEKAIKSKVNSLLEDLSKIQSFSNVTIGNLDKNLNFHWSDGVLDILDISSDDLEQSEALNIFYDYMFEDELNNFLKYKKESFKRNKDFVYSGNIKIKTKTGNIKYLLLDIQYFFDETGFTNGVGFVKDVTSLIVKENELKEALIKLQYLYDELDDKNSENEILLKEVHHRVKNNLQIILSLLSLDKRFNKKNPDVIIEDTENRIHSMALIHEKVYQSDSLANINIKDYICSEVNSLLSMYNSNDIKIDFDLDNIELKMDICTPLGLIINECIINIIKYAFPTNNWDNGDKIIIIKLKENKFEGKVDLIIGDNGIGLPEDLNIYDSPSLGLTIINSLIAQLNGKFYKLDAPGTVYGFEFDL